MCLKDFLQTLARESISATESQIRWAIASGKIDRPELDGGLRFIFEDKHVQQMRDLFESEVEAR